MRLESSMHTRLESNYLSVVRSNRGLISLVLVVVLDCSVRDLGSGGKVGCLCALILLDNSLLLSVSEHEELLFFGSREVCVS